MTTPAVYTGVEVILPFPPKELSPNARLHWREKAKHVREYKEACYFEALAIREKGQRHGVRFPLAAPVAMKVWFVVADERRRDWDNLIGSFKAGVDGLVAAGLITDDSTKAIWAVEYACIHDQHAEVRVTLRGYEP